MAPKKPIFANNINVTGDFIAGDQYNYYYTGDFASLVEYYISPESVFQRVRVDDFIGRDWLTAKVDAFLNDPNRKSGAFLLIGDAGVGKTSFMAHLVKERRYLHLFAEQAPGQAMLQRAMQSLGSQLVTRYQIDPYKDRDTLNALSVFPDFLERILRLAASTLTEGEKIVIVCDALDEAGVFPDHFVFGLPKELPDGVYFILSQRPVNVKLPNFEPVIEKLEAQGEGNLQDMEAYLSAVAKRPEVAGQIRSKEYSEEFFIQTLKEKSQGVWMYLHYIIKEIESGARAPLDVANLPTGLVGYYAEYWDAWRNGKRGKGEEAWDELYAPLLTTLAAAQEAIPVDWLIQWAEVTAKPREVTRLLTEHWRAFITEKEVDGKRAYTPYHLSFKDFITGRVDTTKLPPAQANLVKDLAVQTIDAHKRIVNAFEKECNGEWEKLVERDYPRLHLSAHLAGAGEYENLRRLLAEGNNENAWAEEKYKKEETYTGYLADLLYLWEHARQNNDYALMIRLMLIESSIHSLVTNIPPILIAELVKTRRWSFARCLSNILYTVDSRNQSQTIELVAHVIPQAYVSEFLNAARGIKQDMARIDALIALAPYLPNSIKVNAFETVQEIKDESSRAYAIERLAPYLSDEIRKATVMAAQNISSEFSRARALSALPPYLNMELNYQVLGVAHEIKDEEAKSKVLSSLIPYLSKELGNVTTQEAFTAAQKGPRDHAKARAFFKLIPNVSDEYKILIFEELLKLGGGFDLSDNLSSVVVYLNENLKQKALEVAYAHKSESYRARALYKIAKYLTDEMKREVLHEAMTIAQTIENYEERSYVISEIDSISNEKLEERLQWQIREAVTKIRNEHDEGMFSWVVTQLSEPAKSRLIQDALDETRRMSLGSWMRAKVYLKLVQHSSDDFKNEIMWEALQSAQAIEDNKLRLDALSNLCPHLSGHIKTEAMTCALKVSREIRDEINQARVLSRLVPALNEDAKYARAEEVFSYLGKRLRADQLADVFSYIAPYLNNELKKQALLKAGVNMDRNATALSALVPHLNEELKGLAITMSSKVHYSLNDFGWFSTLAPHLSDDLQQNLVLEVYNIQDETFRAIALSEIIPHLNNEIRKEVINKALLDCKLMIRDDERAKVLSAIAPYLSKKHQRKAFDAARKITWEPSLAHAFSALAPYLGNHLQQEAFKIACKFESESNYAEVLRLLAPYLNDELKSEALVTARKIADPSSRAKVLSTLVSYLHGNIKSEVMREIVFAAGNTARDISEIMTALDENLKIDFVHSTFHVLYEIKDHGDRAWALSVFAPYIKSDLEEQAFIIAKENTPYRSQALMALVPYLSEGFRQRAIVELLETNDVDILVKLIPHLSNSNRIESMQRLLLSLVQSNTYSSSDLISVTLKTWRGLQYDGLGDILHTFIKKISLDKDREHGLEMILHVVQPIVRVAGNEIADELYRTITDVTRWWP